MTFIWVCKRILYYKFKKRHVNVDINPENKRHTFLTIRTAFQSADLVLQFWDRLSFDNATSTCVLDNAANVHIVNDLTYFLNGIKKCSEKCIATIGGEDSAPSGIGSVIISLEDNDGNLSEIKLENALYFPQYPVNIISIACLADIYNDDEGTFIKTSRFSSQFHSKYIKTICHAESCIPKIEVTLPLSTWTSLFSIATWFQGPTLPSVFMAKANFQEPHSTVIPDDNNSDSLSNMPPLTFR